MKEVERNMKLRHRRLISIITSFIMAVTVFGCTSLTFATEGQDDESGVDNTQSTTVATPAADPDSVTPPTREGTESGNDDPNGNGGDPGGNPPEEPQVVDIDAPTLTATVNDMSIKLSWTTVEPQNGGVVSYELSCDDTSLLAPIVFEKDEEGNIVKEYSVTATAAKKYTFEIKAVETKEGVEVSTAKSSATVDLVASNFTKQRLTCLRSDPGYKAVLLEWKPVEGATGYLIFRRRGEERGNIDGKCKDSDGHILKTYKSSLSKGYYQKFQTGYSQIVDLPGTTVPNAQTGKIEYRDGGLQDMNMTYVYFYQYVIVPYYKDAEGKVYYCKGDNGKWTIDKDTLKKDIGTNVNVNTVKNNTVLPMYILYRVKKNKPYYRTNSMKDGKKMGRLSKGTYYIGYDKKDGRDCFYMKKSGTSKTDWWFAQKNTNVIQGYYLDNGNAQNLNRRDWETGYSKKTVLDYVNRSGISSNTRYLIWVSKYAQHTYIFTGSKGNWKLISNGDNFVSTGSKGSWSNLCASGKVIFNSRNINGPINGKQYRAKRSKYWYYNLSKLHSTVRLHSVLYKKKAAFGSGKYYDKTLGVPKSNGCIRHKPGASQFIYEHVPKGTKTLVF